MKDVDAAAKHIAELRRKGALQKVGVALLDRQITMQERGSMHGAGHAPIISSATVRLPVPGQKRNLLTTYL
jgi:hypothetical protein